MLGLLNPWVLLGGLIFLGIAMGGSYLKGQRDCRNDYLAATIAEQNLAEKVRAAIRTEGDRISTGLADSIGKIRVENKTVVQRIHREKEVHHVLTNPDCAFPASTVRVLNDARRAPGVARPAAGERPGAVPAAGAAPGG